MQEDYNNGSNMIEWLTLILPVLSSVVTWWVMRKKRKNDFLADLQSSIDLLSDKYNTTLQELVVLKGQNAQLMIAQDELKAQIEALSQENAALKDTIDELNTRLTGVKTITRTKQ